MTTATMNSPFAKAKRLAGLAATAMLVTTAGWGLGSGTAHADPNSQGCDNHSCVNQEQHRGGNNDQNFDPHRNFDRNRGNNDQNVDPNGNFDPNRDRGPQFDPPPPFCIPFLTCPPPPS
jgi:hypothetical protein